MPAPCHRTILITLALPALLSACGSVGRTLDYIDAAEDTEALISQLDGMSNTRFVEMQDLEARNATAQFNGNAAICAPAPDCTNTLVGDLQLTADFGAGTMDGSATNFLNFDSEAEKVKNVSGQITFSNGVIGEENTNDFVMDANGSLTSGALDIDIDGQVDGTFKGTPIQGLKGTSLPGTIVVDNTDSGVLILGAGVVWP